MSAPTDHDVTADVHLEGDRKQEHRHHEGDPALLDHDPSAQEDPSVNATSAYQASEEQQHLQHQDQAAEQEALYHRDHQQQYQDHQHHDSQHHEGADEEGADDEQHEQHEHSTEAAAAQASAFDFLPFFPNGAQDMNRFAEAWQQGQQQLQAQAAAAAAAAAAATQQHAHHGQQLDEDGKLQHAQMGSGEHRVGDDHNGEHNGQGGEGKNGKVEAGADAGDAGLLLGMAAESNNQAAAQQQVQNAIAAYSAAAPNNAYGTQAAYGSPGAHGSARDAAAAAAAAAAASSGVNPAYAIAAALAAQSQRNGQPWDYAQLTSYANAAAAANPYSNPNYQANIAAYNQQHSDDPSASDHSISKIKVRGSRAPGTVPNTIGGHTHRPGSGHAFCSGPVVEGTSIKRFVFPCPPSVSSGRQKHVQSAQQMADTYPLAEHPCDRCTGYDNPLPCFHIPGNKCVYCKFLSKPCSLQPGGSNSKGIRRADEDEIGKPKKKRKTEKGEFGEGEEGEPHDTMDGGLVDENGGDASAYMEHHQHHELDGVQEHQQLGEEEQAHQVAQDLAAAAAAQQQHEEHLQAQAAQAIQQAQAQQEEEQQEQELKAQGLVHEHQEPLHTE